MSAGVLSEVRWAYVYSRGVCGMLVLEEHTMVFLPLFLQNRGKKAIASKKHIMDYINISIIPPGSFFPAEKDDDTPIFSINKIASNNAVKLNK